MAEQRKRAGIYLRISLDREGKALGVDRQEQACRELCQREGLDVAVVYRDNDRSASKYATKRRLGYEALLAAARGGELDVIVAYSSSRLTRKVREALDLIELAESGRVQLRTVVSGHYDLTTASGRFMAGVFALLDQQESEVNSERSRAEREQRRERGMPNGGQRPFGWQKDGITPHPVELPALRAGVDGLLAGVPLSQVARDWTQATGKRIRPTTARRVLRSARIAGKLPDGRPAVWEPVVSEDEAAALRGILNGSHATYATALMTGWALCGVCRGEGRESTVRSIPTRQGQPGYVCSHRPHLVVARAARDERVLQLAAAYLDREKVAATADTAPIAARHAAASAQLDEVADAFAAGEITREQAARATSRLRAQLDVAERELAAATFTAAMPSSGAAFLALDTSRQRAVLSALPWRVVLLSPGKGVRRFNPETVQVEPHLGAQT